MKYTCECGNSFERWSPDLSVYVCAQCGTLWEPDIQPASLAQVAVIEAEYEDSRYDDDDEQIGDTCPECNGTGLDKWESFRPCDYCAGEGYVWW
jgi:hypothetical protein